MPDLTREETRRRFTAGRVARLATVTPAGHPHLVPVTFVATGADTLVTAVDHKPKRRTALSRLANIAANPTVSMLVDCYDDDWSQLWWARADGHAEVLQPGCEEPARAAAAAELAERYVQYREQPPAGPVIVITVARWAGWAWSE